MKIIWRKEIYWENIYILKLKLPSKWTSKDVCLNNENKCLYYKNFKIFPLIESKKFMVKCSCEKLFGYKCGQDYCSKDKHSCDGLDLKKI